MPIVKIKIDNKEFNLECGDGEEDLLREAVKQLNLKLHDHSELSTLPEANKYLMMALIIISENISYHEKEKKLIHFLMKLMKSYLNSKPN